MLVTVDGQEVSGGNWGKQKLQGGEEDPPSAAGLSWPALGSKGRPLVLLRPQGLLGALTLWLPAAD